MKYDLDKIPLFESIKESKKILISGAGGGYDIFCGIPIYIFLKKQGKDVILGNLSFSMLDTVTKKRISENLVEITSESDGIDHYFPEKYLCEWFKTNGENVSIYGFHRTGAIPLIDSYKTIVERENVDTVILVDGGTDSLMKGDEFRLGTPQEDVCSIAAVDELNIEHKYLLCLGFGVDTFHGISHGLFLENVAELVKKKQFLGTFSLLPNMEYSEKYLEASNYVFSRMPNHKSIVSSSVLSSIYGEFGDYHSTERTRGSKLWINPLMSIYWCFHLEGVAGNCLYLNRIKKTKKNFEVLETIYTFQSTLPKLRGWEDIPL